MDTANATRPSGGTATLEADALRRVVSSMKVEALGLLQAAPESRIAPALAGQADDLAAKADSLAAPGQATTAPRDVEADGLRKVAEVMHERAGVMLAADPQSKIGRALGAYAGIYDLKVAALLAGEAS